MKWYSKLSEIDQKVNKITELSVIETELEEMKTLQHEIIDQVSVPLSYMGEFYTLRMHIQLVINRLEERKLALAEITE